MKHFIVDITYLKPYDVVSLTTLEHRAYLQAGYDAGMVLFSGPKEPRSGGIIVARAKTQAELESFFQNDPFQVKGLGAYKFIEFAAVSYQPFLKDWI